MVFKEFDRHTICLTQTKTIYLGNNRLFYGKPNARELENRIVEGPISLSRILQYALIWSARFHVDVVWSAMNVINEILKRKYLIKLQHYMMQLEKCLFWCQSFSFLPLLSWLSACLSQLTDCRKKKRTNLYCVVTGTTVPLFFMCM